MKKERKPVTVAPNFYQIGTPAYPAYVSTGDEAMIIEGGITATFPILVDQISALGIDPNRIKYLVITHTHPDHIGAVTRMKKLWPHLQVVASHAAEKILKDQEAVKDYANLDNGINEILMIKGELEQWPAEFENPAFEVDRVVKEGDKLDLGCGNVWTIYDSPGHSSCHLSLHNEREEILVVGDATGLYDFETDLFWPNYFDSLETYCNSIRKLAGLPARIGALSHNGTVRGEVKEYFRKAMKATQSYHLTMLKRNGNGDDSARMALETAKWVYTFTNMQPFRVIHGLSKLMMKRSQSAGDMEDLFTLS